jgi:deferrochelatase/peroxidase EfeB
MRENRATEEVVVQFTANSRLAVERGVVETWKLLHGKTDPQTGAAPLGITTFYLGEQREDQRSWIDFHDGLSNLSSDERAAAIAIDPTGVAEEQWTVNGTYLAFARLGIDLAGWRTVDRKQQELVVGRDKLTGCPLTSVGQDGSPVVAAGCPIAGQPITDPQNRFRVAGQASDAVIKRSHIQRANHHLEASDPGGLRIYRQGYPFLEWQESAPGFRAGLNFVSFQDTPSRVTRMLTQPGWLGGTNFGGDPSDPNAPAALTSLLAVYAAGIYFVPPVVDGEPFPGAAIFGLVSAAAPA